VNTEQSTRGRREARRRYDINQDMARDTREFPNPRSRDLGTLYRIIRQASRLKLLKTRPPYVALLREFLRKASLLQGGNGGGSPLSETNTFFLVRLAEHVDVLTDVGEHAFLAVRERGAPL